jgi:hypothetical protein
MFGCPVCHSSIDIVEDNSITTCECKSTILSSKHLELFHDNISIFVNLNDFTVTCWGNDSFDEIHGYESILEIINDIVNKHLIDQVLVK